MLKYVDTQVVFSEIPNEITLAINISGCPNHCPACHSKYLWEDVGEPLNKESVLKLISENEGITCVCLMGGDQAPNTITWLAQCIKEKYPELKVAWYSGLPKIHKDIDTFYFDYIKVGPYVEDLGPLNSPTTNQRLYCKGKHLHKMDAREEGLYDITDKFWKNDSNS